MRFIIFIVPALSIFYSSAYSAPPIKEDIAIADAPHVVGDDKTSLDGGSFGEIYQAVLDTADQTFSYQIANAQRVYKGFYKGVYTCVAPDSSIFYPDDGRFIDTLALTKTDWVAITTKGMPLITDKAHLMGKSVGIPFEVEALVPVVPQTGVHYEISADFDVIVRKVSAGRLDVGVMPLGALEGVIGQSQQALNIDFDRTKPIEVTHEGIMCHNSPRGTEIVKSLNRAIRTLYPNKLGN